MAQSGGPPRAAADAAGDDQPRPDQLQHADQQFLRQPRLRPGAGGDRQSLPHLPAAPGDLLGGDRDRPLSRPSPALPIAGEIDNLRATMANGMRQILFVLLPAAAADPRPLRTDDSPVYQRGAFDPAQTTVVATAALLVRLLAADQRRLPAADAHLLQPPAALGWRPDWR